MDKYVGKRLDGRYEIREIIGVGGMAYVYKAYDAIDDNIVAIKILKDEFLHNEEFSRRFKNESKAIAILSHRNIVRVNDVSFGDNLQYIVMEYIDGITLKEYIEQQKVLQWKEVVHFIEQILHALQHAHDKGIVHQDVKPQNIMLLSDGTIKVTDFGIARFSRATAGQQSEQGEKAIGSVHYISPEQARAEITDEKSDIYSVGVMMYEMLTGKLPFESDNAVSVAIMQMQAVAQRPTAINPNIPEGLEEITLKAMQKDPLKRYQSAAEMLYDIDEFKNNPSIRFEYKYFSGGDDPQHYQEAFSRIRGSDSKRVRESDDEDETDTDEDTERKGFPLIPVLAGVAGALLLVVLIFLGVVFVQNFLSPNDTKENLIVPNLVGQNYEEIMNGGQLSMFQIDKIERYDVAAKGIIFDQQPAAGRQIKEGMLITVYVSKGSREIMVPTIASGMTEDAARSTLESRGFRVETMLESSDTVEKGCVIRTDPAGGSMLPEGETVMMYISNGPEELPPVVVPEVAGKRTLEQAITELKEAGLIVDETATVYVNSSLAGGYVTAQNPAAGESVPHGSTVVLTVSSGCKDVDLPVTMPLLSATVDVKVYIDGEEWTEKAKTGVDLSSPEPLYLPLTVPKESYTVKVELAETGTSEYKLYAEFVIDGKRGEVKTSQYYGFTVATTTTQTTTTTLADETTTTTLSEPTAVPVVQ